MSPLIIVRRGLFYTNSVRFGRKVCKSGCFTHIPSDFVGKCVNRGCFAQIILNLSQKRPVLLTKPPFDPFHKQIHGFLLMRMSAGVSEQISPQILRDTLTSIHS